MTNIFDNSEKEIIGGPIKIGNDDSITKYKGTDGRTFWAYNSMEVLYEDERLYAAFDEIERLKKTITLDQWLSDKSDRIEIGDIVTVYINENTIIHNCKVLYIPCSDGDAWIFKTLACGNIVYVQKYEYMEKVTDMKLKKRGLHEKT